MRTEIRLSSGDYAAVQIEERADHEAGEPPLYNASFSVSGLSGLESHPRDDLVRIARAFLDLAEALPGERS